MDASVLSQPLWPGRTALRHQGRDAKGGRGFVATLGAAGALAAACLWIAVLPPAAAFFGDPMAERAAADIEPVLGFGTALFGMGERAVRRAIEEDYDVAGDAVAVSRHPYEQTTLLAVDVDGLLEIAAPAQVVYVLGYTSNRLIRVDLEWRAADGVDLSSLTARAISDLRHRDWAPAVVVRDQRLGDGPTLLFVGEDGGGRRVTVTVEPRPDGDASEATVRRSYIADPRQPDIYRIPPGAF